MTRTADEHAGFKREYFEDADLRIEAVIERRAAARATRCQCGDDLPGSCLGPMSCPYSDFAEDAS